jgi:hypothetical protein
MSSPGDIVEPHRHVAEVRSRDLGGRQLSVHQRRTRGERYGASASDRSRGVGQLVRIRPAARDGSDGEIGRGNANACCQWPAHRDDLDERIDRG